MKRLNPFNLLISEIIEKKLVIKLRNYKFSLDGWSEVDNFHIFKEPQYFIGFEDSQCHLNILYFQNMALSLK